MLGLVSLVLAIIGIFVPLMPTTSFLILAAWCFARSSKRMEKWLLEHPRLGPPIVAWRENGAIARKHKWMAVAGMSVGMGSFYLTAHPAPWLALLVALVLLTCAAFVWSRPEPAKP